MWKGEVVRRSSHNWKRAVTQEGMTVNELGSNIAVV